MIIYDHNEDLLMSTERRGSQTQKGANFIGDHLDHKLFDPFLRDAVKSIISATGN